MAGNSRNRRASRYSASNFVSMFRSASGRRHGARGLDYFGPRIAVIGIGGAGGNAVDNMIRAKLSGVEFIAANTDAQVLAASQAADKIQLGRRLTGGLGAGGKPEIGRAAAEESVPEAMRLLDGVDIAFITAGLGGGTGTGAAPVIARAARAEGMLTVGVVTTPFAFEGTRRARLAKAGVTALQDAAGTLIVIPNQNLLEVAPDNAPIEDAFRIADDVLRQGVGGITDLMLTTGLVNLDFADVRSVISGLGRAVMGIGEAAGEARAQEAARQAATNPLLAGAGLDTAQGVLVNIAGGRDLTLREVDAAVGYIGERTAPGADIFFGATFAQDLPGDALRVTLFATGIGRAQTVAKTRGRARAGAKTGKQTPAR